MPKIDIETVDKLANLSRLEFDGKEKDGIINDLNRMLDFISKLDELDTTNIDPLIYMNDQKNILRPDVVKQSISQADGLKNAPKKDSDFFKVPKVVGKK
ncbi:MAG TPA: Asp-tRNA(Asn)/Glu-tRNA(Gln) amidotransferase subunit GatC [Bacteroidia bacterium]|nr:Asp-tRNA(Asn)/Glu-tRNA(Gln) amidotransferase subunit GatC [Bacteroidia bacterium]